MLLIEKLLVALSVLAFTATPVFALLLPTGASPLPVVLSPVVAYALLACAYVARDKK